MRFESGETSATDQKSLAGGKRASPPLLPCLYPVPGTSPFPVCCRQGSGAVLLSRVGQGTGEPAPPRSQPGAISPPKTTQISGSREDSAVRRAHK